MKCSALSIKDGQDHSADFRVLSPDTSDVTPDRGVEGVEDDEVLQYCIFSQKQKLYSTVGITKKVRRYWFGDKGRTPPFSVWSS